MNVPDTNPPSQTKLNLADASQLAVGIAELTKAGLPLPAGLRALADELPGRQVGDVLRGMAARIDRGDSFEAVFDAASNALPPHLHGLLIAGIRTGRLPEVMEEYIRTQESQRRLRQRLRLSFIYPIILMIFMTVLIVLFNRFIFGSFERMFRDFGTALPTITLVVFASSKYLEWVMIGFIAVMFLIPLLASDYPGFGWLSPVVYRIPLLGKLLQYARWAMFSKLTAVLLDQRTPLPVALRLVSAGISDPYLRRACQKTAAEVEIGGRLSDAMLVQRRFPSSMIPFIKWGENNTALPEAFSCANELYEGRADSQTASFMAILVPIMFVLIIAFVGVTVLAIFMPLISLITSLTGGGHK